MSSRQVVLHDEENKPRKKIVIIQINDLAVAASADLYMKPWRSAMEPRRLLLKLTSQS
jgi:hypothetical protein